MATGSRLDALRDDLLEDLDLYNANDLDISTIGTSGSQAARAINKALQKLYSKMQAEEVYFMKKPAANTSLSTTSGQDHVLISGITDLGEIENIYETDNDINLEKISFQKYRELAADPSQTTGNPLKWTRRDDRIYIFPQPDATYTLNIFYIKTLSELTAVSDTTAIPTRYDYLILDWAKLEWQIMEDKTDIPAIQSLTAQKNESWQIFWEDISSKHGVSEEIESHWGKTEMPKVPPFDSPVGS